MKKISTLIAFAVSIDCYSNDLVILKNGQVADANDVNANFQYLETRINDNSQEIIEMITNNEIFSLEGVGREIISTNNKGIVFRRSDGSNNGKRAGITSQDVESLQYIQMEVRGSTETGSLFGLPHANMAYIRTASPTSQKLEHFVIGSSDADILFAPKGSVAVTVDGQGYLKISTTLGGVPNASDCDETQEYGRMKIDEVNALLYICTEAGWVGK